MKYGISIGATLLAVSIVLFVTSSYQLPTDGQNIGKAVGKLESQPCPVGWSQFGQKCLQYNAVKVNYTNALQLCQATDASLVSIRSRAEEMFVARISCQQNVWSSEDWLWLAASRNATSDKLVWLNGDTVTYSNWENGCPFELNVHSCVKLVVSVTGSSYWCNCHCGSNHLHFVCEKPIIIFTVAVATSNGTTDRCLRTGTSACPDGWSYFEPANKCYKHHGTKVTGDEAPHICKNVNGRMVTIHSEMEQLAVVALCHAFPASPYFWIGATRSGNAKMDIAWRDNSPMNYISWCAREPDKSKTSKQCVASHNLSHSGWWFYANCSWSLCLVCEKDGRIPVTNSANRYGQNQNLELIVYDLRQPHRFVMWTTLAAVTLIIVLIAAVLVSSLWSTARPTGRILKSKHCRIDRTSSVNNVVTERKL